MSKLNSIDLIHFVNSLQENKHKIATLSDEHRSKLIEEIANSLESQTDLVLTANQKDLAENTNLSSALQDRLTLNESRLASMISGLRKVAKLPDPLNEVISWKHAKGMEISKIRVPIGLILIVYEARPNVTTDAVGLCLKTGNSAILKGSRQTKHTNQALAQIINSVLEKNNLANTIGFLSELSEEESIQLIGSDKLDLIIPRGGENLKKFIQKYAQAPILGAGGGVCHAYISESANLDIAQNIILNGKTQRPGVCNSLETVLIHKSLVNKAAIEKLFKPLTDMGVTIRADQAICEINKEFEQANEADWETEYLDLILSVKSVDSTEEAIAHINTFNTSHSDAIITENQEGADLFCKLVDAACVYVNVSTRFTDGEEFGFGAEIGNSTQKLHARGPIGPKEITTYKYLIKGNGQVR
jgi:glutamate-5-semialdehyde dehydrogenase